MPKRRFPEFKDSGVWQPVPLNRLAARTKQKNRDEKIVRVLTNSAEFGVMDQRDFFDKDIATQGNLESYHVVDLGSYVYNPRISAAAPVGPISKNKIGTGVMSPLYTVFKFKDDSNDFYEHYFKTTGWHAYMRHASSTGARHDRMAISSEDFMAMPLPVSNPKEHQKIADCLSSLDELIAAYDRKVGALKAHKKGLMHQFFPLAGENKPRLRFPEYQNAARWDLYRFDQVFERLKAKNVHGELNVLTISAQDGLISQLEYFNKSVSAKDISGYQLLNRGDFAYNKSYSLGYPWGAIKQLKRYDAGVVSPLYICFRLLDKIKFSGAFFEQYFDAGCLESELEKIAQEGARNHGMLNIGILDFFNRIQLLIPTFEEQKVIADCLSVLDSQITAAIQELYTLKKHKSGLMQQLFPSFEVVKA
jgi:type I restriction enzyme S subunit